MNHILEALRWRYATKQFDKNKKLSSEQLADTLEAVRLSPSSFGLQPYTIYVVSNQEIKEKLKQAGYNQPSFSAASQILVFTVPTNFSEAWVDKYLAEVSSTRNMILEDLTGYKNMIMGFVSSRNVEQLQEWSTRQAYIALGQLLTVAALAKIDAVPMEGFDPKQFDEILGLKKKNLATVVVAGLGFRDEADKYASLAKVRLKKEDLFVELN